MSFIDQPGFSDDVRSVLSDLLALPPEFLSYIAQFVGLNGMSIPVSQLTGFTQYAASFASYNPTVTATLHTYTSLGGPKLSALPDGKYVLLYGVGQAQLSTGPSSDFAAISVAVNGSASDNDIAQTSTASQISIARGTTATLSDGNKNSVELVYRVAVDSPTDIGKFGFSWLIALKYANN